jgi:hypothetical protein
LKRATVGAAAAIVAVCVFQPGWAELLLLVAAFVAMPLALGLASMPDRQGLSSPLWQLAGWLHLPAALLLAAAFALPSGVVAAGLTAPWFFFTSLVALLGLVRLRAFPRPSMESISIYAGLIYLAVGGMWAVLSRLGARPVGFSDIIFLATAVHFHYAGCVLPLLTGLAWRFFQDWMSRLAALGVIVGVPLVALGITLSAYEITIVEWSAARRA